MKERLQKIISASGLMSRRAAEELIAAGKVSVNGVTAALGDKAEAGIDRIRVDGKALPSAGEKLYIMLNKPRGYVTTLSDEKGRRDVSQLVKELGTRLYPVGRLDMYSEGRLIMTNDGDFANRLMHPSHEIDKCYHTWVKGEDIGWAVELLRCPMEIDGYVTRPVPVEVVHPAGRDNVAVLAFRLREGRKRQIRYMCSAAHLVVLSLKRVAVGALRLPEDLKPGAWRDLTPDERSLLV